MLPDAAQRVDRRKSIRIRNGATIEQESLEKRTRTRAKRAATTRYHRTSPEADKEPGARRRSLGAEGTGRRVARLAGN